MKNKYFIKCAGVYNIFTGIASGVPRGGQRGARAQGATLGGAEIDLVFKNLDQPFGKSWPERS